VTPAPGRLLPPGFHGFDDVAPGDRIDTDEITVTPAAIDAFADLTGDRFAIHMSDTAAQELGFPSRVAHGLLVLSLIDGLKNQCPAQFRAIASLGWDMRFSRPVLAGDRIRGHLTVTEKRLISDGRRGILTLDVEAINQAGEVVQSGLNRLMVAR
jgi:acyl dehydratase